MWVVSVMPIGKAAAHKEFSYFSLQEHAEGSIIKIPARGKEAFGLVMSCAPLSSLRQQVRDADFKLQKITAESRRLFSQSFLRAAFDMADFHTSSLGAVLVYFAPQAVLEKYAEMPEMAFEPKSKIPHSTFDIQESNIAAPRAERLLLYRQTAQRVVDGGKSALLITPTIAEAERLAEEFSNANIPHALLHSGLTKKQMRDAWKKIALAESPLVVIGTPVVLCSPRRDLGALILERAGASSLTRDERPFLSMLACARALARRADAPLYLGSAAPLVGSKTKQAFIAPSTLINMRPKPAEDAPRRAFELFSSEAKELLQEAVAEQKSVFLLCARRGFATSTVCDDCGTTLSCTHCGALIVLREAGRERFYRCPRCGVEETAKRLCATCGGWRLSPLGIGAERVLSEAKKILPEATLFLAEEKLLANPKKAAAAFKAARATPAIIIGTEGALPYLSPIDKTIVVSIDSLLYSPSYAAPEQAMQALCELRGLTRHAMLLQSRRAEDLLVQHFASGHLAPFLEQESTLRKKLHYPPFAVLIHIALTGRQAEEQAAKLQKILEPRKPMRLAPSRGAGIRAATKKASLLLRVPAEAWPDRKLLALLRSLPLSTEIRINPRSILAE